MASGLEPVPITSQKHDPAWQHCQMFRNGDRVQLKCLYCNKLFKGGGIHRIKEHLAGHKGNASTCLHVPPDVSLLMQQSLDGVVVKKRKKLKIAQEISTIDPNSAVIDPFVNQCDVTPITHLIGGPNELEPNSGLLEGASTRGFERRKRGRAKSSLVAPGAIIATSGVGLSTKRINHHVHMAVGRFLYDIGAPPDAVNSNYFQEMVDSIAMAGPGLVWPTYHDYRGWMLKNLVDEVKNDIGNYKTIWGRTGCSLLVDQWTTETGRILLDFLVYCPEGTLFLKSVDASDIINSSEALYELLVQVVEEVEARHILQVITSGTEEYIVAGRRLTDTYPTLYWAPCASHSLDNILEEFGELEHVSITIEQARSITRFIYNHNVVLNMMRRHTFGNDIVEPGITRHATNFTTLRRMVHLKQNLQAMVTSQEWMDCPYSKTPGGLKLLDLISNQSFWSSCVLIVHLTDSLLRVFGIIQSGKRPAMGYVYAGMYRAKETIKKEFLKREDYMVYWKIIDRSWQRQWILPLHAAGFYLNPKFFYSIEGDMNNEILSGMFDCIERLVPDIKIQDKIIKEINSYKNAVGDFGRKMAIRARDTLLPAEWWSTYGGGCPNLARLAIRILSQTCSSAGCNRNRIPFDQMHDMRNCIEHRRLNDIVFVQYNLRLRQMIQKKKQDSVDPISLEHISVLDDWVIGKEIFLEEYGSSEWMPLDPPAPNTMLLGSSIDEAEDLGEGFDDYEIFDRIKGEEENAEDNVAG